MCICAKGVKKKDPNNKRGRKRERERGERGARKRVNYVTSRRRAARSRLNKGRFFSLGSPRRGSFPIDEPSRRVGILPRVSSARFVRFERTRSGQSRSSGRGVSNKGRRQDLCERETGGKNSEGNNIVFYRRGRARRYILLIFIHASVCERNRYIGISPESIRRLFAPLEQKRESHIGIFPKKKKKRKTRFTTRRERGGLVCERRAFRQVRRIVHCFDFFFLFLYFSIPTIFLPVRLLRFNKEREREREKERKKQYLPVGHSPYQKNVICE